MNNANVIYLGIAASYIVVAIVQLKAPSMLPTSLYLSVAYVSFDLAFFELVKIAFYNYYHSYKNIINLASREIQLCDKHIETLEKYKNLEEEIKEYVDTKNLAIEKLEKIKNDRKPIAVKKTMEITTVLQVVICCGTIIITPLRKIPDELFANKLIGVFGLLSFSLLSISYYMKNKYDYEHNNDELEIKRTEELGNYYLRLIHKARLNEIEKEDSETEKI